MATAGDLYGDYVIVGTLYATGLVITTGTITDAMIATPAAPGNAVSPAKLRHRNKHHKCITNFGSTPASVRTGLAEVRGTAGSAVRFEAGVVSAITAGSITVDLLKNGTTILTAVITLNTGAGTGGTAFDTVAATIATPTLAQGDTLEANVTVAGLTGGGGLWCMLTMDEDPS